MSTGRQPEPSLDPPDPDWALFWYRNLTALNSISLSQHEAEREARQERIARNVGEALEVFSRPQP